MVAWPPTCGIHERELSWTAGIGFINSVAIQAVWDLCEAPGRKWRWRQWRLFTRSRIPWMIPHLRPFISQTKCDPPDRRNIFRDWEHSRIGWLGPDIALPSLKVRGVTNQKLIVAFYWVLFANLDEIADPLKAFRSDRINELGSKHWTISNRGR